MYPVLTEHLSISNIKVGSKEVLVIEKKNIIVMRIWHYFEWVRNTPDFTKDKLLASYKAMHQIFHVCTILYTLKPVKAKL